MQRGLVDQPGQKCPPLFALSDDDGGAVLLCHRAGDQVEGVGRHSNLVFLGKWVVGLAVPET